MKLKHLTASVALAVSLGSIAVAPAQAQSISVLPGDVTTVILNSNTFSPFRGFDWDEGGYAVTNGFDNTIGVGDTVDFSLLYWSKAFAVLKSPTGSFQGPGELNVAVATTDIEYTVVALLNERATCQAVSIAGTCTTATFELLANSEFAIYYGGSGAALGDAVLVSGTGITNGTKIISGVLNPCTDSFQGEGCGGEFSVADLTGSFNLPGIVNFTNNTYINPNLVSTVVTGTLELQGALFVPPTGTPDISNVGFTSQVAFDTNCDVTGTVCLLVDGSQEFTPQQVPEPSSIALLGLGLLGLGFGISRRRTHS